MKISFHFSVPSHFSFPSFDVIKIKLFGGGRRAKKKRMKILLGIVAVVGVVGFCLVNKNMFTPKEKVVEEDVFKNIRVPLQYRAGEPYPWLYNDSIEETDAEESTEPEEN